MLSPEDVRLILTSPESGGSLARRLGVTKQSISQIRAGRSHQGLFPDLPRRAPARDCHSCCYWRAAPDPCSQGFPDPINEGPGFARDCELYQSNSKP